jgi:muramoyltetrapeptide carboxypeptidase
VVTVTGGRCEGRLLGGNLSLICATLGTPYAIAPEGAVLFIEDVGEQPYRVDRMLSHLRLAGVPDAVAGIVIGRFTGKDAAEEAVIREVVLDACRPLGCPVVADFPCGHVRDNATLPLGARVTLDADAGTLEVIEPSCVRRP